MDDLMPIGEFLCTDGLFNELTADEIAAVFGNSPDAAAAADALVDGALSRGGHDNITVLWRTSAHKDPRRMARLLSVMLRIALELIGYVALRSSRLLTR